MGAQNKCPDPSRIKTLMDLTLSENSSQLKHVLGFIAYNAKWGTDYSNKVAPLLAQKHLAFPLIQASRLAIASLKKGVVSAVLWLLVQTITWLPGRLEPVSERHSVRATNLSVYSRELWNIAKWRTQLLNGKPWLSWKASISRACYACQGF